MKTRILYILLLAALALGCTRELEVADTQEQGIRVYPRVTNFSTEIVDTKGMKTNDEMKISHLHIFIFDGNQKLVLSEHIDVNSILIINREELNNISTSLANSRIYLVANIYDLEDPNSPHNFTVATSNNYDGASTETQFLNRVYSIPNTKYFYATPPDEGFPMIGSKSYDLTVEKGEVTIDLLCLYSKIYFEISVDPVQASAVQDLAFSFTNYQVFNIAKKVRVQAPDENQSSADAITDAANILGTDETLSYYDESEIVTSEGITGTRYNLTRGRAPLKITFYIPEHKYYSPYTDLSVEENRNIIGFPDGFLNDDNTINSAYRDYLQHYKPKFVKDGDKATYVTIKGNYTDQQGHSQEVSYDVYLGGNNWNDFTILRNHEYKNYVTIKGTTNDKNGTGVSCDLRVETENKGYKIGLERETLLDCHIEVRPLRITLDGDKGFTSATVEILNPDDANWIRMEKSSGADADHTANGKRKYFTEDLVTSTLIDSGKKIVDLADGDCVWIYVDENIKPNTNGYRDAIVRVTLMKNKDGVSETITEDYIFRQWDLYKVSYNSHTYYIERYEEYLHSYDSQDTYTNPQQDYTQKGIAWGLEGLRLSYDNKAYYVETEISGVDGWVNGLIDTKFGTVAKYDFYNNSIEAPSDCSFFPYSGRKFTYEIIEEANMNRDGTGIKMPLLDLSSKYSSAIQYVLAKNKVSSSGVVSLKWYLPAIDEIEDIVMGAYTSFDVFQNNFYWSSQPAYEKSQIQYTKGGILQNSGTGIFYLDNVNYARATKVEYKGANADPPYVTADSGQKNPTIRYKFYRQAIWDDVTDQGSESTGLNADRGPGYMLRSEKNRVRAVYNGTDAPTITFTLN